MRAGAAAPIESTHVYAHGFVWTLGLDIRDDKLWCFVHPRNFNESDCFHNISLKITLQVEAPTPIVCTRDWVVFSGFWMQLSRPDSEWEDCASLEWWSPHMIDGVATFTATITVL